MLKSFLALTVVCNYVITESKHKLPASGRRWDQVVAGKKPNKKSVQLSHMDLLSFHPSASNARSVKLIGTVVHIYKLEQHHNLETSSNDSGYSVHYLAIVIFILYFIHLFLFYILYCFTYFYWKHACFLYLCVRVLL